MPGKRTNHCTTQLVAFSTIGWYYIPKITTEDFITYWYGGMLESGLSHINLALVTNIVQIRIYCAYQKIQVFPLIQNFSLQLASMAV